jgi:hypothetical protein
MKNLGKIILSLFYGCTLFAGVSADVDQSAITPGNIVTFSLHITDSKFQKPSITTICGTSVLATSSQTNVSGVNGKFSKTQTLTYSFAPERSCMIDPIEIKTDKGSVKTAPIKIDVKALSKDVKEKFSLEYTTNAKEVFVGEPFTVTLVSKIRRDMKILDSKFEASDMNGFWIKKQQQEPDSVEGDYVKTKITYVLAAQKAGELFLKPAAMSLAQQASAGDDFFGGMQNNVRWNRYISNGLHVKVKSLPSGVDLVGSDLSIKQSIDKTKVNKNEAANVMLTLQGGANFEDVGALKLSIPDVFIFEDDAKIDNLIKDGTYSSTYGKKIAFVSDKSFTVPAIEIKYFDTKAHEVKTLKTEALHVEVSNSGANNKEVSLKIEKADVADETSLIANKWFFTLFILLALLIGFILGVVVMITRPFSKKNLPIVPATRSESKALIAKLIAFKDDAQVKEMIEVLERKSYLGENIDIDKKKLQELQKRYKF